MSQSRELDAMDRERFAQIVVEEVARAEGGAAYDGIECRASTGLHGEARAGVRLGFARALRDRLLRELEREGFEVRRDSAGPGFGARGR